MDPLLLLAWAPIVTGEPVSTAVLTVATAVLSMFKLFGGGVSAAVKKALEGIRGTISQVADGLLRFSWQITRALGKVLTSLHTVWTRVVWPMLRQLPRAIARLRRLIERDLPRLLRYIERIRQRVLEIYERWARPVLIAIQRLRRMILILRLLHIHWGDKLDRRLAELQGWVMKPITVVLEHIAVLEQWINEIITAEQLLQETLTHNTLWNYQGSLVRAWWAGMTTGEGRSALLAAQARQSDVPAWQSRAEMQQTLRTWQGPLVDRARKSAAELWAMMAEGH